MADQTNRNYLKILGYGLILFGIIDIILAIAIKPEDSSVSQLVRRIFNVSILLSSSIASFSLYRRSKIREFLVILFISLQKTVVQGQVTPPDEPIILYVKVDTGNDEVVLQWLPSPSEDTEGYIIYRDSISIS